MRSRMSMAVSASDRAYSALPERALFDPFFVLRALKNLLHKNTWRGHVIGIDGSRVDELLDLGDGHAPRRRHHRVEITGSPPIDEVADAIALPRVDERKIGANRRFEHVVLAVDDPRFLSLSNDRPVRRRREEAADSGSTGANTLGERSLRDEFHFQFTAQVLPLELLVFADVGRNHLPDLMRLQQNADAEVVDAGIVADDRQIACAACVQSVYEVFWNPAEAESPHQNRGAVGDLGHGRFRARQYFVHGCLMRRGESA